MTRDEILKCTDEGVVWDAIKTDEALLHDEEVYNHWLELSRKGFERHKQFCIDAVGYYDPDICIDPIRRSTLKKYRFYRLNRH